MQQEKPIIIVFLQLLRTFGFIISFFVLHLWLGMYIKLAYWKEYPVWANVLYYIFLVFSAVGLFYYLWKMWRPNSSDQK